MQLTLVRWAFLFTGVISMMAGKPALGWTCCVIWAAVGVYQIKTGRF